MAPPRRARRLQQHHRAAASGDSGGGVFFSPPRKSIGSSAEWEQAGDHSNANDARTRRFDSSRKRYVHEGFFLRRSFDQVRRSLSCIASHPPFTTMSRSFFAPDGQTNGSAHPDAVGASTGPAESSTTTEYGRSSPPPSERDDVRVPFLGNGNADASSSKRRASVSDSPSGESLAGLKALPPILSYCSASIMMTVVNKVRERRKRRVSDFAQTRLEYSLLACFFSRSSSCRAHTSR